MISSPGMSAIARVPNCGSIAVGQKFRVAVNGTGNFSIDGTYMWTQNNTNDTNSFWWSPGSRVGDQFYLNADCDVATDTPSGPLTVMIPQSTSSGHPIVLTTDATTAVTPQIYGRTYTHPACSVSLNKTLTCSGDNATNIVIVNFPGTVDFPGFVYTTLRVDPNVGPSPYQAFFPTLTVVPV